MSKNSIRENLKSLDISVSTKELADLLGLSSRRIQQLSKINILKTDSSGKYPLFESLRAYLYYLRNLLRRYMRSLKIEIERAGRRTHHENLAFYGDLSDSIHPFSHESLRAIDDQLQELFKTARDNKL